MYTKTDDDFDTIGTAVSRGALANDNAGGTFPNCTLNFLPMQCQHCARSGLPEAVCPTGATQQREDGIVLVDTRSVHRVRVRASRRAPTRASAR